MILKRLIRDKINVYIEDGIMFILINTIPKKPRSKCEFCKLYNKKTIPQCRGFYIALNDGKRLGDLCYYKAGAKCVPFKYITDLRHYVVKETDKKRTEIELV